MTDNIALSGLAKQMVLAGLIAHENRGFAAMCEPCTLPPFALFCKKKKTSPRLASFGTPGDLRYKACHHPGEPSPMTDNIALSGLAKQMVLAGLLDDKTAQQAQQQAARNKLSLVTYVVQNKLAKGGLLPNWRPSSSAWPLWISRPWIKRGSRKTW